MKLLVVADDLGLCAERDAGILEAAAAGRLSGASLLVNMPGASAAAQAAARQGLSLGLHFNCTEGSALQAALSEAAFCGKEQSWRNLNDASAETVDLLVAEFEAQCVRFEELCGYPPRRFDGHQHIHLHPRLVAPLSAVAQRRGIAYTRAMQVPQTAQDQMSDFYRMLFNTAPQSSTVLREYNLRFAELLLGASCSLERVLEDLQTAQAQCCELLLHPGYRSDDWDAFSASVGREMELQWLLSGEAETQFSRFEFVRGLEW